MIDIECPQCGFNQTDGDMQHDDKGGRYCYMCGTQIDHEYLALLHAEKIGVTEYEVDHGWMRYWSYFGNEGFYFIRHNVFTGEETRKCMYKRKTPPEFLMTEDGCTKYNYFCG